MDEQKEFITTSISSEPNPEPLPNIDIPTLRTYKGDINQTVNRDKITTAKILIAEQKKKSKEEENNEETSVKRPTNIVALVFGVIFLIGAIGVIGYFGYTKVVMKTFAPITVPNSFLFVFDTEKFIDVTQNESQISIEVQKNIQEVSQMKDNTFTEFVFFKKDTETDQSNRISSLEFFKFYNVPLPTNIARSISKDFVYGMYKVDGRVEPFLVVGLVDYENTYSAMFAWESTIALDVRSIFPILKDLFDISKIKNNLVLPETIATTTSTSTAIVATTTASTTIVASSTESLSPEEQIQKEKETYEAINRAIRFVDVVFSNRDARAVRDTKGKPFFYYAFINRDKVLFAQDPKLLNEIVRKIKDKSLVR